VAGSIPCASSCSSRLPRGGEDLRLLFYEAERLPPRPTQGRGDRLAQRILRPGFMFNQVSATASVRAWALFVYPGPLPSFASAALVSTSGPDVLLGKGCIPRPPRWWAAGGGRSQGWAVPPPADRLARAIVCFFYLA